MSKISTRDAHGIARRVTKREEFDTHGALSGRTYSLGSGIMRGETFERFCGDVRDLRYVIYSYATPIAWQTPDGWVIPSDRYSATTSRHQSTVRQALTLVMHKGA